MCSSAEYLIKTQNNGLEENRLFLPSTTKKRRPTRITRVEMEHMEMDQIKNKLS